jgi:hypothetical protein
MLAARLKIARACKRDSEKDVVACSGQITRSKVATCELGHSFVALRSRRRMVQDRRLNFHFQGHPLGDLHFL